MYGNYDSMVLLLDCLKRRENWPEEFISALEEGHPTIAADIRREYDALRGSKSPLLLFDLQRRPRSLQLYCDPLRTAGDAMMRYIFLQD